MRINQTVLSHILLLSANLFYGINFTVAKIPMPDYIKPEGLVLLRCLTAMLFFWLLVVLSKEAKKHKIEKKDIGLFILSAFFGIALNQLLFFKGLEYTTPISGSIIMTTTPIAVLLIAVISAREKLTKFKFIGLILGFAGAIMLILSGKNNLITEYARNPALGNTLILINAISYAIYIVISKRLILKYDSIVFMKWVFTIGFLMVLPFGFQQVIEAKWIEMNREVILSIIFILIFVSCLTYYFNTIGLKNLPPSSVGMYIYSQPVFAVIVAILLESDKLSLIKVISTILIFVGVYLVSMRNKSHKNERIIHEIKD